MKLSLAWICDYIDVEWETINVDKMMEMFNQTTAEIEGFYRVEYDISSLFLGVQKSNKSEVFIPELNQEIVLPIRNASQESQILDDHEFVFFVKKEGSSFRWASLSTDFGIESDRYVPAVSVHKDDLGGNWRGLFETTDVILEIDNKSITHRPDMWSHRGFAREIAAFLELPFKSKKEFLASHRVVSFEKTSKTTDSTPFIIDNQAMAGCKKFNGLYFPRIHNKPSNIFILSRLMKVEAKPLNGIVDLTNYVALDWGQPVHAYDAGRIADKKIVIRMAEKGEKLRLLNELEITLTQQDIVIADSKKPMCLAGIKGGLHDSVSKDTESIFFEAANFDAGLVRKSALHHKIRNDSSSRFEKTLDPNLGLDAVLRFIQLVKQCDIAMTMAGEVISVGNDAVEPMISVSHAFLEGRLGQAIPQETIVSALTRLEFGVEIDYKGGSLNYLITVPSFRSSKDIKIKEDILEEVARMYGFSKIRLELPYIHRNPFSLTKSKRTRRMLDYFVSAAHMTEFQNYPFYDEQFLKTFELDLASVVSIVNPVTENNHRLVTTLIPGLLKNLAENSVHKDTLFLFEKGRVWQAKKDEEVVERKEVSGIFFEKRKYVDFYEGKHHLERMFELLGFDIKQVVWTQMTSSFRPWYKPYQSAYIYFQDTLIGYAGIIDSAFFSKFPVLPESSAFLFELDVDVLCEFPVSDKRYEAGSRYQESSFDLSMMIPLSLKTATLKNTLKQVSPLITTVELRDFFEKEEWGNQRSLTFRLYLNDNDKTLEKEQIDMVMQRSIAAVEREGAKIRIA